MEKIYNADFLVSISLTKTKKDTDWEHINKPEKSIFFGLIKIKAVSMWNDNSRYGATQKKENYFGIENENKELYLLNNEVYRYPIVYMRFTDRQYYERYFINDEQAEQYYNYFKERHIKYPIKEI